MPSAFLTADFIHDGHRFLEAGSVLEVAENGSVIDIHKSQEIPAATHYPGVLLPGFVNAHCHLELFHLKDAIPEGTGLIPFLQGVTGLRNGFSELEKEAARKSAYDELVQNGIVAVGDICNTDETLGLRMLDQMHMHSFIECIGFTETHAAARLTHSRNLLQQFSQQKSVGKTLRQSIVPHAPYSVSPTLFRLISDTESNSLISIHNQECAAENEYYLTKSGAVCDLLSGFGIDDSFFVPSGKSSLQTYLPLIDERHPIIFVHNTFSSEEDFRFAESRHGQSFWCLCPNANLYIEGRLPDIAMMQSLTDNICIGTDSLASNKQLSIWAELLTLKTTLPELEWEDLFRWATLNGARALQFDHLVGSFKKGTQPGILNITDLSQNGKLTRIF